MASSNSKGQYLPSEILQQILAQLKPKSLAMTSLVCRSWLLDSQRLLYTSVIADDKQGPNLVRTLSANHALASQVLKLALNYPSLCADEHAATLLPFTVNLEALSIKGTSFRHIERAYAEAQPKLASLLQHAGKDLSSMSPRLRSCKSQLMSRFQSQ